MRTGRLLPYLVVLAILIIIIMLVAPGGPEPDAAGTAQEANPYPAHPGIFMTKEDLYRSLSEEAGTKPGPVRAEGKIISGVLPHHLVAGRMITRFMENLAVQKPEVIILAGPNHYNLGGKIITGLYDWQTPDGLVKTDRDIAGTLLEKRLAVRDEEVLSREHAVGGLMPFIRHFMPQARVVPLIFHHDVSLAEIDALLEALEPYLGGTGAAAGTAVVVASVDFSHYLTRQEAEAKDEITLKAMRELDYTALYQMGNDHLDSPASLALAFRAAEKRGIKDFEILENTNSGVIFKNDIIETTSYFTLVVREEE